MSEESERTCCEMCSRDAVKRLVQAKRCAPIAANRRGSLTEADRSGSQCDARLERSNRVCVYCDGDFGWRTYGSIRWEDRAHHREHTGRG